MAPDLRDFVDGGAETEWTVRRNRDALGELAFRPRVLVDVRERHLSTTIFGTGLRLPVFLAPIGSIARIHHEGALAVAAAATQTGSLAFLSVHAIPGLSATAEASPAPLVFQIYGYDDQARTHALIREAEEAGCVGVCFTVNSAVYGRREREIKHGFQGAETGDPQNSRAGFTWQALSTLRERTSLPIALKGIQDAEDARLAIECGVDVVYVSNLGGRQLDFAPPTIEVLPEIVAAVGGRATVLIDGGFRRGTDILKALALGANAVGLGRLQAYALAAGGAPMLERAFEILAEEMRTTMALIGVRNLAELGPAFLRSSPPARSRSDIL